MKTIEEKRRYNREYMARWRAKRGPVELTEDQRQRARERYARWSARNPGRHTPYDPTAALRMPWSRSLGVRQAHAKKRGIAFTLKVKDVRAIWTGVCALTGLPFELTNTTGEKGPRPFSPSLDRIQPELGYVPGNIRFILHCVNAFKGTMDDDSVRRVAAAILKQHATMEV